MPQTTIYVSPRSHGAPNERPPGGRHHGPRAPFRRERGAGRRLAAGGGRPLRGPPRPERRRQDDAAAPAGHRHPAVVRHGAASTGSTSVAMPTSSASAWPTCRTPPDCTTTSPRARTSTSRRPCSTRPDPTARVERALADVGLLERAGDRVRDFSAGMRRRLGARPPAARPGVARSCSTSRPPPSTTDGIAPGRAAPRRVARGRRHGPRRLAQRRPAGAHSSTPASSWTAGWSPRSTARA